MIQCAKWKTEHDSLIKQQNSYFNPAKHFGLTDHDWTYFNLSEVIDIQHNWKDYYGNNVIYFGKYKRAAIKNINHVFICSIADTTTKAYIIDNDFIIHPDNFDLHTIQKQLLLRNIKAIVYDPEYEAEARHLQWLLEDFIKAYPVDNFEPDIKLYSVYTLVYGNIKPEFIIDAVESILSQKTTEFYTLEYIFILDPPFDQNSANLQAILKDYHKYATFKIICNTKYLNYTGSYLKALRTVKGVYAFNQDIDDLSHIERFYWSAYYLNNNPDIKAVSFVPVKFKFNINSLTELENYRQSHLNDPYAVWLNANMFHNTISINPQSICIKQEILSDIKLNKDVISNGLLGGDQFIIAAILYNYPFGIINNGKALYFYRMHEYSACNTIKKGFYIVENNKIDMSTARNKIDHVKQELAYININKLHQTQCWQEIADYLLSKNIRIQE